MTMRGQSDERGAALVTVLMIVAIMSAVALGLSQAVLASSERARSLDAQAQLRLYAAAAEEVAQAQLTQLALETGGKLSADLPGFGESQAFPVEGGSVSVRVRDLTNCYNVNQSPSGEQKDDEASIQRESLPRILESMGFAQGDSVNLAASLADWIDEDQISRLGGAEDAYYIGFSPAYRTSSQPLANLSELLAIRGFEADRLGELHEVLCALPEHAENPNPPLNLNTLTPVQATRLNAALSYALDESEVRGLIQSRPLGGWPDVETFIADPVVARVAPEQRLTQRLSVMSSLLETTIEVSYREEMMRIRLLLELAPGQPVRVLRRERIA